MLMFYFSLIDDQEDQITFEHIFYSFQNDMMAIAYSILKNREDAEDAVQTAMLNLAISIKSVPTNQNEMRAYSLATARNAALRIAQKNAEHKPNISLEDVIAVIPCDDDIFDQIVLREEYENLLKHIDQLPLYMKECLLLRYVAGLPPREIGKLLGRKTTTVQKQLARSKALLIKMCGGKHEE